MKDCSDLNMQLLLLVAMFVAIAIGWMVYDLTSTRDRTAKTNWEHVLVAVPYGVAALVTLASFALLLEDFVTRACL